MNVGCLLYLLLASAQQTGPDTLCWEGAERVEGAAASHAVAAAELENSAIAATHACTASQLVAHGAQEAGDVNRARVLAIAAADREAAEAQAAPQALEGVHPKQAAEASEAAVQAAASRAAEAEAAKQAALAATGTADLEEAEAAAQAAADEEDAVAEVAKLAAFEAAATREAAAQAAASVMEQERAGTALLELCRNGRCPSLTHGFSPGIQRGTCCAVTSRE